MAKPKNNFVFMKVGKHSGEEFESILDRKASELKKTGSIWWGYGGPTLHPIKAVQPFADQVAESGQDLILYMQIIESGHEDTGAVAVEYSDDGLTWSRVPKGIEVRGSRYALIIDEITAGTLDDPIDMRDYRVGTGPSEGRVAAEYLVGRVDKGCFSRAPRPNVPIVERELRVDFQAQIKKPYAVLLR